LIIVCLVRWSWPCYLISLNYLITKHKELLYNYKTLKSTPNRSKNIVAQI
jgi:hypothetical protein